MDSRNGKADRLPACFSMQPSFLWVASCLSSIWHHQKGFTLQSKLLRALVSGAILLASAAFAASDAPHWGYDGKSGPDHWGELAEAYEMCAKGKNQSPIDLTTFVEADLPPLRTTYKGGVFSICHNGHTVKVNAGKGSRLHLDGKTFFLKQFHFHSPSENMIDGHPFPMEVHLVHATKRGELAVVAIMMEKGAHNDFIAALWNEMPEKAGETHALSKDIRVEDLLPEGREYFRFNGSLTTPPCSEGVFWVVMKSPIQVSKSQVKAFQHVMHHPNNRPIQKRNARPVLK